MARLQHCPSCSSTNTTTIESRSIRAEARRRRHSCYSCGHRWTVFVNSRGRSIAPPPRAPRAPQPPRPQQRRLTADQVRVILESPRRSLGSLGDELGVSRETVRQVRLGFGYTDVCPELPRQKLRAAKLPANGPSCLRCVHWEASICGFGFPDPELEGAGFAADCDFYVAA